MLLHFIRSSTKNQSSSVKHLENDRLNYIPTTSDLEAHIAESCKAVSTLYGVFKSKASEQVSQIQSSGFLLVNYANHCKESSPIYIQVWSSSFWLNVSTRIPEA